MAVNATQIAHLLAIARSGSFTKAAIERGISQPALSNSIALLEQRLGVKVLERSRRGSTLTRFGEILSQRAEGLQILLEDAELEVKFSAQGISGPVRIGATPSVLPTLIPQALTSLTAEIGPVSLEVIDGLDQAFSAMLLSGEIDIVVGPVSDLFPVDRQIVETPILRDPIAVAVGPNSRFAGRAEVSLSDLVDEPWILPRSGSNFRDHVEAMFRSANVPWPRDVVYASSIPLVEGLVLSANRIAIATPIQLSTISPLTTIPVNGCGIRTIGYKVRKNNPLNEAAGRFLEHLKRAASASEYAIS